MSMRYPTRRSGRGFATMRRGSLWLPLALSLSVIATSFATAPGDSVGVLGVTPTAGVADAQSAQIRLSGTVGQWTVGRATAPEGDLSVGFWAGALCNCKYHGDIDQNGLLNIFDVVQTVNVAFRGFPVPPGDPLCPHESRADVDCSGTIDVIDVVMQVAAAFRNDDRRCKPCAH